MARVICPFCLKQHDMTSSCPDTGEIAPPTFVKEYDTVKPLWLVTIGFKQHGKTTYLAALTLMLEKLSIVLDDVFADALDQPTIDAIRRMRIEAKEGKLSGPTVERPSYRPLLLSMYNLPESGSRCLVMYDIAGEAYTALDKTLVPAIRHCTTTWFLISLSDLPEDKEGKTITELFKVYRNGMENMKVDLRGRNLVVVYTKADKEPATKEIKEYLRLDPFQNLTLSSGSLLSAQDFSLHDYIDRMRAMSNYLRDYTRTRVDGGASFINMVKAQGMNLEFCVTSALGQGAENGAQRLREDAKRFRVLDPFFWAIALDMTENARSISLVMDAAEAEVYQRALGAWDIIANHGDVTTYFLGQTTPAGIPGQRPPAAAPRQDYQHLIGPILENAAPDTRMIVMTSNRILDLMDFYNSSWRDRLVLVPLTDDARQDWPRTAVYRPGDTPDVLVDALLRV
jgi:hypothetical protein